MICGGNYTKLIVRLFASWCIAHTMLGWVAAEESFKLQHEVVVTDTVIPSVEFSDTAIQQVAQRLTFAQLHSMSFASSSVLESGSRSQLSQYRALAEHRDFPKGCSLFLLGISLRL